MHAFIHRASDGDMPRWKEGTFGIHSNRPLVQKESVRSVKSCFLLMITLKDNYLHLMITLKDDYLHLMIILRIIIFFFMITLKLRWVEVPVSVNIG